MGENKFRPGELFVYTRDGECQHMELGQVARKVDDETYACWYSTGDTAARTNIRNMRKLANAGWSHVERCGLDDCCCMEELERDDGSQPHFMCDKCMHENYEDIRPKRCPECGRFVQ